MSRPTYALQRDANEQDIVDALIGIGASVVQLHEPCDLIVGYRGVNYLIEVKLPPGPHGGTAHSQLTENQLLFRQLWRGQFAIARSIPEAFAIIGAVFNGSEKLH